MAEVKDSVKVPKGEFELVVKNRNGEIVEKYVDHNVIVNLAKPTLAYLLSDPDKAETKTIHWLAVSESPNNASAQVTDEHLPYYEDEDYTDGKWYKNAIESYDYPEDTPGTVRFHWGLDFDEAVNMVITDFGLLCQDGTLFSHKTRGAITKDPDLSFTGTWSIIF